MARAAFDQLAEIVDAVGDRIDVMMDGGVQRGTHVLKALSLGAKAVGLGRYYLFPLAAAGRREWSALDLMRVEIERALRLMGCKSVGNWGGESAVPVGRGWTRGARDSAAPCRCARVRVCSRCGRHAVMNLLISFIGR